MAEGKTAKKGAKTAAKSTGASSLFSAEEHAAIRDYVKDTKAERAGKLPGESEVLQRIKEMAPGDRAMAERVHAVIKSAVPELSPKLWYGMPAYAKDGKMICFFQPATKFKTRYGTLGFSDNAKLDEGNMWPNSYALLKLTAAEEKRIGALVKQAAS
jgi:uncharacterized protein YdhG (YjbR/CyaY superfamily)